MKKRRKFVLHQSYVVDGKRISTSFSEFYAVWGNGANALLADFHGPVSHPLYNYEFGGRR
jgi:hypothetical protein